MKNLFLIKFCFVISLFCWFPCDAKAQLSGESNLQFNSLPAQGEQQSLLTVSQFGRYAIQVHSDQGTALQFVDRMLGPSAVAGQAGVEDGRIDQFLDRGQYKIITYAHPQGAGDATLTAQPFETVNSDPIELLIDNKIVEGQLADLQQRVYWIDIKQRQTVFIEAAGRSLADFRLWKDGVWLTDAEPQTNLSEPVPGKPLNTQILVADLNPGWYQLIAYGGIPQDWAKSSDEQPFYLRMGIPSLPQNGRQQSTMSPFGVDRYLIPAKADFFRLELQQSEDATLSVAPYVETQPLRDSGRNEAITKKDILPFTEIIDYSRSRGLKLVSIQTDAGKPYILQHFWAARKVVVNAGRYFVSSLHSGASEDSVDATALLTDYRNSRQRFVDDRAITINQNQSWHRRFNLLEQLTLFIEVTETGDYLVSGDGPSDGNVIAEYRFEPFLVRKPRDYQTPNYRALGESWSLDKGFYVLTINPLKSRSGNTGGKGIANLAITRDNRRIANRILEQEPEPGPGFVRFKELALGINDHYTIYMNKQPGVLTGIDVRPLPINLSDAFGLTLFSDETLDIQVEFPSDGELSIQAEDNTPIPFSINYLSRSDNALTNTQSRQAVKKGIHQLRLENPSEKNVAVHLRFVDEQHLGNSALPALTSDTFNQLPNFPSVEENSPQYLSLERSQPSTFTVKVKEPALYRLESTGLLQTEGNLRTRVNTNFDRQANNGIGRNFLIQQYLREGDYQVSVKPQGKTKGDLGLRLQKNNLLNGGDLSLAIPTRYTLPSGSGLIYEFAIDTEGTYTLQSYGLKGSFSVRLEDEDGWPLLKPGVNSFIQRHFKPGRYRYIVLPGALEQRLITELNLIPEPVARIGHGPFTLDFDQTISHRWLEPDTIILDTKSLNTKSLDTNNPEINSDDNERRDDQWEISLPADAVTVIKLSVGMIGELIDKQTRDVLAEVSGLKPNKVDLRAGTYVLSLRSGRINNRFDYTVMVSTEQLLVGQQRNLSTPSSTSIVIGDQGITEISSRGRNDVRAKLFDENGILIGSSDDRSNDWNFAIVEHLATGTYRLQVDSVNGQASSTQVSIHQTEATDHPTINLPQSLLVADATIHRYPFSLTQEKQILAVTATSDDTVGLTIEKLSDGQWNSIATINELNPVLNVAIDNNVDNQYRLSVWSPERRQTDIDIHLDSLVAREVDEYQWNKGVKPKPQTVGKYSMTASTIQLNRPGVFIHDQNKQLFWTSKKDNVLRPIQGKLVSGESDRLWLVALNSNSKSTGKRLQLNDTAQIDVGDSTVTLDSLSENNKFEVLIAQSRIGQVGIGVLQNQSPRNSMAIDGDNAVTVFSNKENKKTNVQINLWKADNSLIDLPTTVTRHQFSSPSAQKLAQGISDISIAGNAVNVYTLTPDQTSFRLTLAPKTGAALFHNGQLQQVLWANADFKSIDINSTADQLALFNTNSRPQSLSVLSLPAGMINQMIGSTVLYKRFFGSAGTLHLETERTFIESQRLSVHGDAELMVVQANGKVERKQSTLITPGARVILMHDPGFSALWLRDPDKKLSAAFSLLPEPLPLDQPWSLNDDRELAQLTTDTIQFVRARSNGPLAMRMENDTVGKKLKLYPQNVNDFWIFAKGTNTLLIEPMDGGALNDNIHFQSLDPLTLSEGLGEPITLAPGEARLFSFLIDGESDEEGPKQEIGIGVRGSTDIARCRLYNDNGDAIGEGVSQFHRLSSGRYYLVIDIPSNGKAVDIQAALVGLEAPSTNAPDDIKATYQRLIKPDAL